MEFHIQMCTKNYTLLCYVALALWLKVAVIFIRSNSFTINFLLSQCQDPKGRDEKHYIYIGYSLFFCVHFSLFILLVVYVKP